MPLAAKTNLGPYEILSPIGAGGMGDVYKARDTRLNRTVALKVSKSAFTDRFEREARAVAALNHPNICTVHDVGPNYLVMEYIEGQPLKGPLPLDQAFSYAIQICDALDAAHRKGITHRDLKPANILVTKTGLKLLDFGLAKTTAVVNADDQTVANALTGKGEILGTLHYMSPEQLQGKEADPRSDIFSFGLVLYEMLTGKKAFDAASPASIIGAILERAAPSISAVAPPALDRLLQRCLTKDPDDRWQSARDLKAELQWIATAQADIRHKTARRSRFPWPAGVPIILLVLASAGWWRASRPTPRTLKPLVQFDIDLGRDVSLPSQGGTDVIVSPDGARLAYVSQSHIITRRLDQPNATDLAGTLGATSPFFSPDGQWIAFIAEGKLKKISVNGGGSAVLCDSPSNWTGGSWGEDGAIVAALSPVGGLMRVSAAGGVPEPVTQLDGARREASHRWPQILPGGKAVLFTSHDAVTGFDDGNIEIVSFADHRRKTVQRNGMFGRYLGTRSAGYLMYVNHGTLFAAPFSLHDMAERGTPVPMLQVRYSPTFGSAQVAFSNAGTAIYRRGGVDFLSSVDWIDGAGKIQPLVAQPGSYFSMRLSPDGKRVALVIADGNNQDIHVYDSSRETTTRLTFGGGQNGNPLWTPDGRHIIYRAAAAGILSVRSDGSGKPQPLIESKTLLIPGSLSADGKKLAYVEANPVTSLDVWTVPVESDSGGLHAGRPESFVQTAKDELSPSFSPDGHWMAYVSNESGNYEVYVGAFPDRGGKWQISTSGGQFAHWSPGGRELFFVTTDNRIMVAEYTVHGDSFEPGKPRLWFAQPLGGIRNNAFFDAYDPAPDGKHIAALLPARNATGDSQPPGQVTILENFLDELRRRVPDAGK